MVDLTAHLGIPFSWTGHQDDPLHPLIDAGYEQHVARSLEELRPFLEDPDANGPMYVYHVYEGVHLKSEKDRIRQSGLGIDLTMLWPGQLTREWFKTAGHNHSGARRSTALGELVEVVNGQGIFLLQSVRNDRISETLLVSAQAGEWVLIPPGFEHVTLNTGQDVLALTFLHAQDIYLDYESMARHRGAGLWIGPDGYRVNSSYQDVGVIRRLKAHELVKNPAPNVPLYELVVKYPERFQFLFDPSKPFPWA